MRWKGPLKSCNSRGSDRSEHGSRRTRHHRRLATRTPVDPVLATPGVASRSGCHHGSPPRTPVARLPRLQELPPERGRHPASRCKSQSPSPCVLRSFLLSRVAISGDVRVLSPRKTAAQGARATYFKILLDTHRCPQNRRVFPQVHRGCPRLVHQFIHIKAPFERTDQPCGSDSIASRLTFRTAAPSHAPRRALPPPPGR
jgi:hypothetical protein